MRTKEVQDAIELLEKIKISESMNVYIGVKDVKKANALLKYIEELEEKAEKSISGEDLGFLIKAIRANIDEDFYDD